MVPLYSPRYFQNLTANILNKTSYIHSKRSLRQEKELLGVSSLVCYSIWEAIYEKLDDSAKPEHLLWALIFLKTYSSENTHSIIAGCSPVTFRKWSWEFIVHISNLNTVRFIYINIVYCCSNII